MQGLLIFPDDVAVVDLLHTEPLARTIAEVIRAHSDHGLVLGVHGDWERASPQCRHWWNAH